MKKKILCLAAGLGLVAAAALATAGASSSLIRADETDVEWHHYDAVKATETSIGSREYWVSCADHTVQFTAPTGEHDKVVNTKTHESDYLTYLATKGDDDARYTVYTPNAFKSESNFYRYIHHNGWDSDHTDYASGIVSITTNASITYKLLQDAHELDIKYLYFYATLSGANKTDDDTITAVVVDAANTTTTFSETSKTFYQTDLDANSGFSLTLDVERWYTAFSGDTLSKDSIAFNIYGRNKNNADAAIKGMTFSDLNCFTTEAEATAYKTLKNMFNTNGYDYFHYGTLPTYDGNKFVFTGDGGNLGITMKLVNDVKAAGKTKVSFKVKMATTEEGVSLTTAVWTTEASGTNAAGESVSTYTDWNSVDLVADGIDMTLNVSKLFGESVTGDVAYYLRGRLADGSDYKERSGNYYTLTISDIKIE